MNSKNSQAQYLIKHILSNEWITAKYLSDTENSIEFLIEDTDGVSFEKDDKIIYSIKSKNKNCIYNTVVLDIDLPTYDKITITIKKPLERRIYSRYNVNLLGNFTKNNIESACNVVDIAKGGLKIASDVNLKIKELLDISIFIDDNEVISACCAVIYKSFNNLYEGLGEYLYGLKLVSISHENKILLQDFVDSLQ